MKFIVIGAAVLFLALVILRLRKGNETPTVQPVRDSVKAASVPKATGGGLPAFQGSSGPPLGVPPSMPPPFPNPEALQAMRDNPEIKKKLEENFRKSIEVSHGEFISALPPELQDKVRGMMLNHRLGLGDLLVAGSPPPPVEKLMERDKAHEAELKQVLGEKSYGELTEYNKTIPSRRDVSNLEAKAAALGVPLTAEQKRSVLEIINAERVSALSKYSPESIQSGLVGGGSAGGSAASGQLPDPGAVIKAFEADQAAADQAALSKAEGILSEKQADLLLDVLREKLDRKLPTMPPPPPALTPAPPQN